MIRIALDLMGGDRAPEEIKAGALMYLQNVKKTGRKVQLVLVGLADTLKEFEHFKSEGLVELVEAQEALPMDVKPTDALRRKNSSMYIASQLVKEKKAEAIVSAGNTGALLSCATLVVGRLPGVDRPALAVPVPSLNDFTILIDAGANAEVKHEWLIQFAAMGIEYAKILGKRNPKVGLLNVGTEENKGTELEKQAYQLLKQAFNESFYGNVEGNDINIGTVDVVVTNGFSGNIAMKTMEGVAKLISHTIKQEAKKSLDGILGALLFSRTLKKLKKKLDPRTYGGSFFLGVDGIVVKAHGNSDRIAIYNAIDVAVRGVEGKLVEQLNERLKVYNK
ncbi:MULTISPECIES: phosphate acyltransferase PlsX [Fervidobacterium]|uniref:Phosphate acyltransferase n=1 Tax=Fervidobacterium nodosum (strain ATCC 35602 / DSM 5306 / Rt17-B1) TaxID=381764 RepID=PLSX_FERNB|nr:MULTISPECIES: phosphate acyltransferase PlsX [Fervidobacterium]A7HLA7.1 RecName: Full=Phosphate acyltransferase; AltName: Full=Acyl-ACP phosphotransacylase; AltName: Full=Acyl-[acyl-carrier-protein]--phosphate acyltransferase; AltName: Full=Phosphate-acyl-ACP acyltransferase [Fervidobacterium nodosum Rt17-B1]ABS60690.1 fatty acid/phospholipid synthesis protein PlsX [Fervidobacterium nodosum Rt17-B1]KAF2961617.1 phosphate acyltransferase [Fervidobacterium sp. 2310opik-2]PHJ13852.1 phosphate a